MSRRTKPVPSSLISADAFVRLPWWGKLTAEQRTVVERESNELARARFHEGASKLEQGKHLLALRDQLEPYRVFVKHLKNFRLSLKTAYRYMNAYTNARRRFSDPVLAVLLSRGWEILGESETNPYGKYTPVIQGHRQLAPPKTSNPDEIVAWAQKVEHGYKEYRSGIRMGNIVPDDRLDPDVLLARAFRSVRVNFQKLPRNHKSKSAWMEKLVGMLLNELGVAGKQAFAPIAVPDEFRRGPGRPALTIDAEAMS